MERFTIELAGVPIEIQCRFAANRAFFKDYMSQREPVVAICPTEADLSWIQRELDRMYGMHCSRSDVSLENSAIHTFLAEALVDYGVLLMHGSALCMDGMAVIFAASSGTGKSTHARLWREAFGSRVLMINDDKPLIRLTPPGAAVYGSPWSGKHHLDTNTHAPLKAIVNLRRGAENRITPLTEAEGFQVLFRHAFASEKPDIMKAIARMESALAGQVSFYDLSCNMSREAALTAWQGIFQGMSR